MGCKFVTNCANTVDWKDVIDGIKDLPGAVVVPDRSKLNSDEYQALFKLWDSADFNLANVKWINYYPQDLCYNVAAKFEEILGVKHIRSWVSRIDPGYSAPWHYDIDHDEQEYLKLGQLRRFVCYIGEPAPGHISIIEDSCHYLEKEGNIYEWDNYRAWHAGANVGLTPKYQYNFLAYSLM